jgi:hypothetical protein
MYEVISPFIIFWWHFLAANICTMESQEIWRLHSLKPLMRGGAFHVGMILHLR